MEHGTTSCSRECDGNRQNLWDPNAATIRPDMKRIAKGHEASTVSWWNSVMAADDSGEDVHCKDAHELEQLQYHGILSPESTVAGLSHVTTMSLTDTFGECDDDESMPKPMKFSSEHEVKNLLKGLREKLHTESGVVKLGSMAATSKVTGTLDPDDDQAGLLPAPSLLPLPTQAALQPQLVTVQFVPVPTISLRPTPAELGPPPPYRPHGHVPTAPPPPYQPPRPKAPSSVDVDNGAGDAPLRPPHPVQVARSDSARSTPYVAPTAPLGHPQNPFFVVPTRCLLPPDENGRSRFRCPQCEQSGFVSEFVLRAHLRAQHESDAALMVRAPVVHVVGDAIVAFILHHANGGSVSLDEAVESLPPNVAVHIDCITHLEAMLALRPEVVVFQYTDEECSTLGIRIPAKQLRVALADTDWRSCDALSDCV